ncbi:MAG TPA: hypothetical protein V6D37_00215 [Candidatus Sericytochromatia bacterium]
MEKIDAIPSWWAKKIYGVFSLSLKWELGAKERFLLTYDFLGISHVELTALLDSVFPDVCVETLDRGL